MLGKKISQLIHTQTLSNTFHLANRLSLNPSPPLLLANAVACSFGACAAKKKSLTKFSSEHEEVMAPMQTHIATPTLRNTKIREAYSEEFDRTPACNGCSKCGDWSRDIPLMTT